MVKLTKREKIIVFSSVITIGVVWFKLKDDVFKVGAAYNSLANKLCSGGIWMATDVTPKGFNLIRAVIEEIK